MEQQRHANEMKDRKFKIDKKENTSLSNQPVEPPAIRQGEKQNMSLKVHIILDHSVLSMQDEVLQRNKCSTSGYNIRT